MNKVKYIAPILLLFSACSSEKELETLFPQEKDAVEFLAAVGDGTVNYEQGKEYKERYFNAGDRIRLFCPVGHSTPNFQTDALGMYFYSYTSFKEEGSDVDSKVDWANWPYKFTSNKGFDWNSLQNTGVYYIFEALHFPGDNGDNDGYLKDKKIPTDQSDNTNFKNADMLIAHHRQLIDEKGKPVKLTFHHAFAMVEVTVKLPVSNVPNEFPKGALKSVYMKDMLPQYNVNYTEIPQNDGARTVDAVKEETTRQDIQMCQTSLREEKEAGSNQIIFQEYVYRGIVPEQELLAKGEDFLYFNVGKNGTDNQEILKTYKFKGDKDFSLKQGHILSLKLKLGDNENEMVVVKAELLPWADATTSMDLLPAK